MVYIVNDGRKVVTSRSGDNYFTSACIDVCLSFCFGGVESGALQNYVYAKLSPWAVVSIRESIDFDVFAIYCSMCGKFCAVRSMNKALNGEHIDIL